MAGKRAATVSARLDPENLEFLDERLLRLRPYDVSRSSLINLCVRIVRQLEARGDLSLEPEQLRKLLATNTSDIVAELSRRRTPAKRSRQS